MPSGFLGHRSLATVLMIGFVAGALATLTFHQITIWLLTAAGALQGNAYSLRPVSPLGVPQVLNIAFWGGIWGAVFALLADRFPRSWPLWLAGLVFGAVAPTLVAWFIVAPLKGQSLASGFNPARVWGGPVINGMWGLGTGLFYEALRRWSPRRARWA
jgi:hypothetical protein